MENETRISPLDQKKLAKNQKHFLAQQNKKHLRRLRLLFTAWYAVFSRHWQDHDKQWVDIVFFVEIEQKFHRISHDFHSCWHNSYLWVNIFRGIIRMKKQQPKNIFVVFPTLMHSPMLQKSDKQPLKWIEYWISDRNIPDIHHIYLFLLYGPFFA